MIETYGLSHVALAVADPERSLVFYSAVFGVEEYFRDADTIQVKGPGPHDVLAFERRPSMAGERGGILHFGFRLKTPEAIETAIAAVLGAGGAIRSQGEFVPGCPYAFVTDPDGYEIEIWFE